MRKHSKRLTLPEVVERLRVEVAKAPRQEDWAAERGVSRSYVANVLRGLHPPGPKILAALGLRKVDEYEFTDEAQDASEPPQVAAA